MKFPIRVIIGLAMLVIGAVGLVFCLLPQYSAAEQVVANYVSAIDAGDIEKMASYTSSGSITKTFGDALDDFGITEDALEYEGETEEETVEADPVLQALRSSSIAAPDDAVSIQSVELIGCTSGAEESAFGMTGCDVTALVRIEYTDANEVAHSKVVEENFPLIDVNGYKLAY